MPTFIVIGGGVVGLNTAYRLARKQMGKVVLLEKGQVGDGSSSRAGGIVTGLLWTEAGVRARKLSLRLFNELSTELAEYGYQFQNVGCLNLFGRTSWPEREAYLPLYDQLRVPYEILSGGEMQRRWPGLRPDDDIVGLYDPLGGYSEPHEFIPALARRCRELGVEIWENVRVDGLRTHNGRVIGVETAMAFVPGDAVVSTVHAWTLVLLSRLNLRLPVKSFVHQRYVSTELAEPIAIPAINANPLGGYIRPARLGRRGSRLLAGGETAERAEQVVDSLGFHMAQLTAPAAVQTSLKANLAPLLPSLSSTHWETEQVGLISFSMDGEPVLGGIAALPGLYVGAAFHSGGFAYSPVAGYLLAELAAGETPSVDISSFSPERFDRDETTEFLATTVTQANVVRRRH